MFVWDWLKGVLGFLAGFWKSKSGKLLFLGLDKAGKTTMLQALKKVMMAQHPPTLHPTSEEVSIDNVKFITFDLGGHDHARCIWKDYFSAVDAIVFFIDVQDTQRFPESKKELLSLLNDKQISDCPILILGNKIDLVGAATEQQVREYFELNNTTGKGNIPRSGPSPRPLELFMCSVLLRQGYDEGFRWLSQYIN